MDEAVLGVLFHFFHGIFGDQLLQDSVAADGMLGVLLNVLIGDLHQILGADIPNGNLFCGYYAGDPNIFVSSPDDLLHGLQHQGGEDVRELYVHISEIG